MESILAQANVKSSWERLDAKEGGKVNRGMVQHIPVLELNVSLEQLGIESLRLHSPKLAS